MKSHSLENLDQNQKKTFFGELFLHAGSLRGMIHTAEGKYVASPMYSPDGDVNKNIRTLEAHCTECETLLGAIAPTFQFSADLKPGGTRPAVTRVLSCAVLPGASSISKNPTLTEKILAARGVKSLDELNAAGPYNDPLDK